MPSILYILYISAKNKIKNLFSFYDVKKLTSRYQRVHKLDWQKNDIYNSTNINLVFPLILKVDSKR